MAIKIVGDLLCCQCISEKGGSQVVDDATGRPLITEALLELVSAASRATAQRCDFASCGAGTYKTRAT
jgi:hypothetical protein